MYSRRKIIQALAMMGLAMKYPVTLSAKNKLSVLRKEIPSSGAEIPAIGMGTWITFDHHPDRVNLNKYVAILEAFFAGGGQLIDSSPMYGNAQQLLGAVLPLVDQAKSMGCVLINSINSLWRLPCEVVTPVYFILPAAFHWFNVFKCCCQSNKL